MLKLQSQRWQSLYHARGRASDLPALLASLPDAPPIAPLAGNPWYDVWSRVCDRGTVDTASFAALPHLVCFAADTRGSRQLEFLSLAAAIEAFRHMPGSPEIPEDLLGAYTHALTSARAIACGCLAERWSEEEMRDLVGSITVFHGHVRLGAGILLGDEDFSCSACGSVEPLPGYAEIPEPAHGDAEGPDASEPFVSFSFPFGRAP